jgi:phage baseplate assembly protein W
MSRLVPSLPSNTPQTREAVKAIVSDEDFLFDGDFETGSDADYLSVTGDAVAEQEILQCLETVPGDYALHPEYGVGVSAAVKHPASQSRLSELQQRCFERIPIDCPSVQQVRSALVEKVTNGAKTGLKVTVVYLTNGRLTAAQPFVFFNQQEAK